MAVYGAFNQGSSPLRLAVRKRPAPTVQRKGSVYMHALLYLRVHVLHACICVYTRNEEQQSDGAIERRRGREGWRTRGLNISGGLSGLCWLGIAPTREWPLYTHTSERQTATRTWNTVWNSRLCGQDRGSTEQTFSFLHFPLVGSILFLRRFYALSLHTGSRVRVFYVEKQRFSLGFSSCLRRVAFSAS